MSGPGHILIVEDSSPLSDAFRVILERSGYRVSVANSLAGAMEIPEPADLVLLDVTLPDGDGVALLGHLAQRGRPPRACIALTGRDDRATRERCISAGCADVMVKPVAFADLVDRVRSLLA